jgi:CBS-domain-containing membrane protein
LFWPSYPRSIAGRDQSGRAFHIKPLADDEPAIDALAELYESKVNRGLVVDDGGLIGLLSITDILRALEVTWPTMPLGARRSPASG